MYLGESLDFNQFLAFKKLFVVKVRGAAPWFPAHQWPDWCQGGSGDWGPPDRLLPPDLSQDPRHQGRRDYWCRQGAAVDLNILFHHTLYLCNNWIQRSEEAV